MFSPQFVLPCTRVPFLQLLFRSTALLFVVYLANKSLAAPVETHSPASNSAVNSLTQIVVTFSEPVAGVDANDLLVNNDAALAVTGSGSGPYTFTFAQPLPGAVNISWDFDHGISGLGTGAYVQTTWSYTLADTLAPSIAKIQSSVAGQGLDAIAPLPGATVGALTQTQVIFSEDVTGVEAGDLLVNGVAAVSVTGSGAGPYLFTFPQPAAGAVNFQWIASHGIVDAAANAFAGGAWSVTLSASGRGVLIINEFLAANATSISDENLDQGDWIEIYNPGTSAVNLAGWALTTDADNPGEWIFPSRSIAAGGYLVVYASGKDRRPLTGNLHTNFKINENSGYLALMPPDFPRVAVSQFNPYPVQRFDYSYGVQAGGGLRYFARSLPVTSADTRPGAANGASALVGITSKPNASVGRGFFKDPFQLVLTCSDAGATIRYTLDGSDVTALSTAYTAPLNIAATTVLRTAAFGTGTIPSATVTHTYLFLDQVFNQTSPPYDNPANVSDNANPQPPSVGNVKLPVFWGTQSGAGFPGQITNLSTDQVPADYGMDPEIYNDPNKYDDNGAINNVNGKTNFERIKQGLRDLPALSVVLKSDDMWGATNGMYTHPTVKGAQYEKPCSLELLLPDGSTGFTTTCGLRIHGNASRSPQNDPKHGFNINFKGDYGTTNLEYQLFPDSPVTKLDDLVLRGDFNSSWLHHDGSTGLTGQRLRGTRLRDAFCKDTFRAMGRVAGHNRYVNLFINGIYWGTYDPAEKESDFFAANYFGGDKSDYDVYEQGVSKAGTTVAYNAMTAIASPIDSTKYELMKQYLDIPEFADYMLLHFWTGHQDWGDDINKNWYAVRNRKLNGTFKYLPWDQENLMWDPAVDRTTVSLPPSGLHTKLVTNPQYLLDFADRVHKQIVAPDGPLQSAASIARFNKWRAIISNAIAAESARWGDYRRDVHRFQTAGPNFDLYTWNNHWITEVNRLTNSWFPNRNTSLTSPTVGVLPQLRSRGLYPTLNAPQFVNNSTSAVVASQRVASGFSLKMQLPSPAPAGSTSSGTIYYTTDGSDPRVYYDTTGQRTAAAQAYTGPIAITATKTIKARALNGTVWSALNEAAFAVGFAPSPVRITEIMYNPPVSNGGSAAEFVELLNTGTESVNLGGWSFEGIDFVFPNGTLLGAGSRFVVANNGSPAVFAAQYPGVAVGGYFGGSLDNSGERLALRDAAGRTMVSVEYDDAGEWPLSPDGGGTSLEIIDPNGDPDSPANWRASSVMKGTPGQINSSAPAVSMIINEVLASNAGGTTVGGGAYDYIELKNTGAIPVDLNSWVLSAAGAAPVFTSSVIVPPGGFVVVPCSAASSASFHLPVSLSDTEGIVQLLTPAGARADAVEYGNQIPNFAIGRIGGSWTLTNPTPGAENTAATLAPVQDVALNEWLANSVPGDVDWIELYNKNAVLPAALKGLYVQTNSDLFQISALSFIAPHGYLQLFCDEQSGVNQLDFKLPASGTTLSLLDAAGAKFDSVTFGAQVQGVSQGRNPDGTGVITSFASGGSGGAANYAINYTGPVLNEVLARNAAGAQAPWGTRADWVELSNPGNAAFDLSGMRLSVINNAATAWTFPAGTSMAPQSYLVIWCDPVRAPDTVTGSGLNTGFALGDNGGALYLFNPAGQLVNSVEWGFQLVDRSIGLVSGSWKLLVASTPAAANSAAAVLSAPSGLKINEWIASPSAGADWFELYNPGINPANMSGLYLTDDPSEAGRIKFQVPDLSFIAGSGWVKWEADNAPELGRNHVNFNLDSNAEYLRLSNTDASVIDTVSFGLQTPGVSQGRFPDGETNVIAMPFTMTPGAKNARLSALPASQSFLAGANVSFTVNATGSGPLSYQWTFNGAPINGATSSSLALNGISAANDGNYASIVTGASVSATSTPALLIVRLNYAQWAASKGVGGALEDPDGDGLSNAIEFFHNTNPKIAATAAERLALPQVEIETGTPAYLTMTYRQSARAELSALQHQISLTLGAGSWVNAAPDVTEILPSDPLTGDSRVRVKFSIAPGTISEFARLLVTP